MNAGELFSANPANFGQNDFTQNLNDMFGWGSAARERQFSEYMSNTAYQRAAQDMKNAGLNPALMFSSGASAANAGSHAGATATNGTIIGQIGAVINSAANLVYASNNKYKSKDENKIINSAQQLVKIASLISKMTI